MKMKNEFSLTYPSEKCIYYPLKNAIAKVNIITCSTPINGEDYEYYTKDFYSGSLALKIQEHGISYNTAYYICLMLNPGDFETIESLYDEQYRDIDQFYQDRIKVLNHYFKREGFLKIFPGSPMRRLDTYHLFHHVRFEYPDLFFYIPMEFFNEFDNKLCRQYDEKQFGPKNEDD